ncbi:rcc01693 family protein [uncultured Shimia sp.]|uniref:rcc01693 family protein n=1 Tax=uncultured Shimia sp. TaxID=573152 RepID=UPI0025ED5FF6|nr:rcc01693 family protein [uncultured Shimia sp.]
MAAFDWPELLTAGVQQLGLKPREFWQLTPAELVLMLGPDREDGYLARPGLERLMSAFPDTDGEPNHG